MIDWMLAARIDPLAAVIALSVAQTIRGREAEIKSAII